ncbi:hypothetical protein PPL_00202 [Heterostelium album PN500]|uniref:Uncharacterized protein n=1 Tax=Heterostelium pallidum (strain ATCC 26659 / Pp 5 / PN500) TaxID=670386 RepID=D3AVT7_HETP5|nr:hypothetical protein PPL_00202 [Heterostelium album PN500]EFA86410.1 hypothetical protein PPL_00202 [Heterostelium album PN500]|eukprot:XP_020438515.1 hypothetical protein PPL_00202 [Heterostelium album PN500]
MSQYHYNISKDVKSTNIQITGSSNATPADTSSRYYSEFNHSTNLKQSADKYTQKNEYEEPRLDTSKPAMVPVGTSLNDLGNYYLGNNSFLQACYLAYSQHHNLVIRPDDIWIAIMTQFSFYLNAHAEQLRSKIVSHDD